MKVIDRIRKVRESADAKAFVELWAKHKAEELLAHEAVRMVRLGRALNGAVAQAMRDHVAELVPTGFTHQARAQLLELEVGRARDRALRKVFPELVEFLDLVVEVLKAPKEASA